MRIGKKIIDHMAKTVVDSLLDKGLITAAAEVATMTTELGRLITDDLTIEDRLNEEVKEILRAHENEIDRGNIDYARMFSMVKRQLVRERGLIL